jgi:hypothetical protein
MIAEVLPEAIAAIQHQVSGCCCRLDYILRLPKKSKLVLRIAANRLAGDVTGALGASFGAAAGA